MVSLFDFVSRGGGNGERKEIRLNNAMKGSMMDRR